MSPVSTERGYVSRGHKTLVYSLYLSLLVMLLTGTTAVALLAFSPQTQTSLDDSSFDIDLVIQNFADGSIQAPPGPTLSDRYAGLVVKAFAAGTAAFALCTLLLTALYGRRIGRSEN